VHEGGFRIEKDYRDRWFFKRPDGRAVPSCGYRAQDMTDDDVETADQYFHADTSAEVCASHQPSAEGFMSLDTSAEVFAIGLANPPPISLPDRVSQT
jgi:hypothetical protein